MKTKCKKVAVKQVTDDLWEYSVDRKPFGTIQREAVGTYGRWYKVTCPSGTVIRMRLSQADEFLRQEV